MNYVINEILNTILKEKQLNSVFDIIMALSNYYKRVDINSISQFNMKYRNIIVIESFFKTKTLDYDKYIIDFYIGLCYASIILHKKVFDKNVTYGLTIRNIKSKYDLFDYLAVSSIEYKPISIELAEFVKYSFFCENRIISSLDFLNNFGLDLNDYILLISELLWPSYFVDIFKKNSSGVVYELIEKNICDYFEFVFCLINAIKNRYNAIPVPIEFIHLL